MNLSPTAAKVLADVVAAVDEVDRLLDLATPFVPEAAAITPIADKLRALLDKVALVAVNAAGPAAAEVAAADAAAAVAEGVKFP